MSDERVQFLWYFWKSIDKVAVQRLEWLKNIKLKSRGFPTILAPELTFIAPSNLLKSAKITFLFGSDYWVSRRNIQTYDFPSF